MTRDPGVWTAPDCALVLIDDQEEMVKDQAFRQAVAATRRKRLVLGGLHTEICPTFAAVQALKDGSDVLYVTDAAGGRSKTAHRTGTERLALSAHGGH